MSPPTFLHFQLAITTFSSSSSATVASGNVDSDVAVVPLERPIQRTRRRSATAPSPLLLPYFIAGAENRLASFVARQETSLFDLGNPLLFTGPVGSGKTSLALHVAQREANQLGYTESSAILHLPASDFSRRFAEAVSADDLPPFREEINRVPVLVIDDLHLMLTKPAAQEELAARIEHRTDHFLSTILTCRRMPTEIRGLRPSLVSRSLPGLTIPLKCPSGESRRMLLFELAMQFDVTLDEMLLAMLDEGLPSDAPARSLAASMKQIDLWCRMHEKPPCVEAVTSALEQVAPETQLTLKKITTAVARRFGLRSRDLLSSSRKAHIVRARSLAMLLARRLTPQSMNRIGDHFGGRDHTTVMHAIRKTEAQLDDDADLRQAANEISEKLSR